MDLLLNYLISHLIETELQKNENLQYISDPLLWPLNLNGHCPLLR